MSYPASGRVEKWLDALPSGNGKVGISVYGGIVNETIIINHEDLWWKGIDEELVDVSDMLPALRKNLDEGNYVEAEKILPDTLKNRGYSKARLQNSLPVGDIKIKMPLKKGFKDYSRSLDMETGEVSVKWKENGTLYERVSFVSRANDLIVCQIRKNGDGKINAGISLQLRDKNDLILPDNYVFPDNFESFAENEKIFYAANADNEQKDFGIVAKVIYENGNISKDGSVIRISGSSKVTILAKVFVNEDRTYAWEKCSEELDNSAAEYEEQLDEHVNIHKPLFDRVSFGIGAKNYELTNEELLLKAYNNNVDKALIEKMWSYGRYLLITSSYNGGLPCTLTGLWNGRYEGFWDFNMANENIQLIYSQALPGNITELIMPVYDYYENKIDDFRINAKKIYGCRGIYVPANTTPESGQVKDIQSHLIHWTGAAGWISQMFYDYYRFTCDINFLKNRAMPFMYEAALFYEDFFIVGDDGYYISYPSNSPENISSSVSSTRGISINSTMDFAIAKELLSNLIKGSTLTNLYKEKTAVWEQMIEKIPQYKTNEDGAVCEWMHNDFKDKYYHRHLSHLYPIFPGTEVIKEDNNELFEAFLAAVNKRMEYGLTSQTSWSLAHMANVYARMGKGDSALECLKFISQSCIMNNFLTVHNDWRSSGITLDERQAPYQIDGNMGWTAAVLEMLVYSREDFLRILPALPKEWEKGHIHNALCRGGYEVSIDWDMNIGKIQLSLFDNKNEQIRIKLPYDINYISPNNYELHNNIIYVNLYANVKKTIDISINR